ncbi:tyrosine-type recombinase/integrase [Ramlibacter solisilvae]|uniref:Integrase n=1 Tax=Ramlibacter tataouinensis TaxID=94132 RepID=A0A127JP27_9BURK|nr:tyrosine-type recombinase/integrase [Ramlibacter tataouinensis]AMO21679.1 integrase [Ramlibacter tataouinensis]
MATSLSKVAERHKLKPRRDPYWTKISKGCYLGYRKMSSTSEGTWLARLLDEGTGKQVYKPLGSFSELPEHQRYDAALKAAMEWFEHLGRGGSAHAATVRDACDRYVEHVRESRGTRAADDVQARFRAYVLPDRKLTDVELTKLTPAHIEGWRKSLRERPTASGPRRGEKRSDSSLNRDMTCLRAALNLAYRDGLVTSDFAWRSKLLPVKNADRRRDIYLDADQRRQLVIHAPEELATLLRGLSLIPLRPGALAALTVASYDKRLKTLTIGRDKAGKDRKITLPDATATFFADLCKDKLPGAPLFSRASGKAWDKDAWKYPVKDAVTAAKLPDGVTCYAIRHSVITDLIHSGLDTLTVAQLSGTSVLMIERHYGHLTRDHARDALARLVL